MGTRALKLGPSAALTGSGVGQTAPTRKNEIDQVVS